MTPDELTKPVRGLDSTGRVASRVTFLDALHVPSSRRVPRVLFPRVGMNAFPALSLVARRRGGHASTARTLAGALSARVVHDPP